MPRDADQPDATGPSPVTTPDERLIVMLADGHRDAFEPLFDRYSTVLLTFLTRMVGRQADADDLLQETFLRVLRHAGTYNPEYPARPWLYAIARHVVFDALKKRARGAQTVAGGEPGDDFWTRLDDADTQPPEQSSDASETRAIIVNALEKLPPAHREVVILGYFEQMSYAQIAEITGESEGTLRSRMFYALRKLREQLKGVI